MGFRVSGGSYPAVSKAPRISGSTTVIARAVASALTYARAAGGQLSFVAAPYSGFEGTVIQFGVTRQNGASGTIAVDWSIDAGEGQPPAPGNTGTITWNTGEAGLKQVGIVLGLVTAPRVRTISLSNPRSLSGGAAPTFAGATTTTISVSNDTTAPGTVSCSALATSSSSITVTYGGGTDSDSGFKEYVLERSLTGSAPFVELARPTSAGMYIDGSRSASTTYFYRVTAFDKAGNSTSASASATTQSGNPLSWQLPVGHYTQAKVAPVLLHPRPDSETQSWERCRLAPSGFEWRDDVTFYGGAWPFEFMVTDGPSGLNVGQHLGDPNYRVMNWANPVVGSWPVTIRVRTQDYGRTAGSADPIGEYFVTFTLVVADKADATKFVHLNAVTGADANAGTEAAPIKTLARLMALSTANKQTIFHGGTYLVNTMTVAPDLTNRSRVWIGYPGELPVIDFRGTWSGGDCYLGFFGNGSFCNNFTFLGSPTNIQGAFDYHHINTFGDRWWYLECTFDGIDGKGVQSTNFSNWSGIAAFANLAMHKYVGSSRCTFKNFKNLRSGGACIWYCTRYWAIEDCTITGFTQPADIMQGFIGKGHCARGVMRHNSAPQQDFGSAPFVQYQGSDGDNSGTADEPNFNEVCWNYGFQTPPGHNANNGAALSYGAGTYAPWIGWVHRNTFVGVNFIACSGTSCSMFLENNVLLTEAGVPNDGTTYPGVTTGLTMTQLQNVVSTYANRASVVDSAGLLLNSYLTANGLTRGTRGHEVA